MATFPDGGKVEIFGPGSEHNRHFDSGPVARFLVGDVAHRHRHRHRGASRRGVEILLEADADEWGNAWVHFRAPDGNIYEFAHDPGVRSGSPGRVAG